MLELIGVQKRFFAGTVNERVALRDLSLVLKKGDFVTVIGSNGAGKSTLLNMISGRLAPDTGRVLIDSKDVSRTAEHLRAKLVSRVFQDPMLGTAPRLTIEENLAIALTRGQRRGLGMAVTSARRQQFRKELASLEMGLEDRLAMRVGMLSGGQRQALSLLMATFVEPRVLLLDEHTAALDPSRAELISKLTAQAVERHHLTTLMVTHNMEQALALGNRLIMMHEGEIVLDVDHRAKASMRSSDLLAEFAKIKGATLSDRTLLE